MKNLQRGFGIPLLIAILALLAIGGGFYVYTNKSVSNPNTITPSNNIVGGDKDEHGCIGSAGYSWCEVKNKCLRVWEEKCEVASVQNLVEFTFPTSGATLVEGQTYNIIWKGVWEYSASASLDGRTYALVALENEKTGGFAIGRANVGQNSLSWTVPNMSSMDTVDSGYPPQTDGYYIQFSSFVGTYPNATLKFYPSPQFKIISKNTSVLGYITSDQVGLFHIKKPIPDQTQLSEAKYSIKETVVFREGDPQKQFVVSMDGKDLLTLESSSNLSEFWDIIIISSEFKTKEGIGVGSTIADFIKAYPNYKFWYSEEEGEHFVLNTSNSEASPQFLLDRNGLINPDKNFNYPTHIQAKISDFKTSAKIVSIRVY